MADNIEDSSISELRAAVDELKGAVAHLRDLYAQKMPEQVVKLPAEAYGWNFTTFEKYINQRFSDLALNLRERYEAQQIGLTAALAAAEKAVSAALVAAEKAVNKAEAAQQLRNEAQNEFRAALADLSKLMWTRNEGSAAVDSLRRELTAALDNQVEKIGTLESGYSNLQGRIWAISAIFTIATIGINVWLRFLGH